MRPFLALLTILLATPSPSAFAAPCQRIISMSPSITESLFAIGLGKRVIGVGRYDQFPKEVASITRIGGLLDPNLELIASLKPDLVVGLDEQAATLQRLTQLGVRVVKVEHRNIEGLLSSLGFLGEVCEVQTEAAELVAKLRASIALAASQPLAKPTSVLLMIANSGASDLKSLYVSGRDGFYSDLLRIIGAQNVFDSPTGSLGGISQEGLIALNPEVIIVISSPTRDAKVDQKAIEAGLRGIPGLLAAQSGRIYFIDKDYAYVPGPRFVELLHDLEKLLRPDTP